MDKSIRKGVARICYLYGQNLSGQITNEIHLLFVWTNSVRTNNKLGNDRLLAYPTPVRSGSPRTSSHCVGQLGCWRDWGNLLEVHVKAPRHSRTEVLYKRPADVGLALHGYLTFCFDGEVLPLCQPACDSSTERQSFLRAVE